MRLIEGIVGETIILVSKWTAGLVACLVALLSVGAGLSLIVRAIYWLRLGYWVSSICDARLWFLGITGQRYDRAFLCVDAHTGWEGADKIIDWFFWRADISFVLLFLSFILLGVLLGCTFIIPRGLVERLQRDRKWIVR